MVGHQRQSPVFVTVKVDKKVAHTSFQAGRRPARKLVLKITYFENVIKVQY